MRGRSWFVVAVAMAAVLLLLGRAVSTLIVDHAWFAAMGATSVWWERLTDTALLQGGACMVGALFAFANLHAVRTTILAVAVPSRVANIELTAMLPARRLWSITVILAMAIGIALAVPLTNWTDVALARHGIAFGEIEGMLNRDLGFYVYWLPLEETMYVWALVALVAMTTVVLLLYALTRSLRLEGRHIVASTHVRRHLTVLGALVLLLLAWSYRLDAFDLLRDGSGPDGLFLRVDHVVSMRMDLLLCAVCAVAALLIVRAGWMGQLRLAFITLSLVLGLALGLRNVLPLLAARGTLLGDPARREIDYVATRALVSRRAYDVDGVRTVGPDSTPTFTTRTRLGELARVTSVWDESAIRSHGVKDDVDIGKSARSRWITTADGSLAALVVRQPVASAEHWTIHAVTTTQSVLHDSAVVLSFAPADDESDRSNQLTIAPGLTGHRLLPDTGGSILGTPLRNVGLRIAHAWAARDPSLLSFDTLSGANTVFVSQRDVRTRVALLAPIFAQGDEVLPLLYDGALYWTVDLYSASDSYPLSQHWLLAREVRSYFRLAATALVDARSGRVRLLAVDRPDPIARTWMMQAPTLFDKLSDLPSALVDALPPATDGALAQLRTFARYGSRLEGSVLRHVADSTLTGDGPPAHLVRTENGPLVAWSVPLLDANDQLGGVVTAVGGRRRGTYWDSTTVPRARWSAAVERLRVALDSARVSLPEGSRREPRMRAGRVQVVMGENGPILLQALQWNQSDGTQMIARVGVWSGDRVGIGSTTADALARLGAPAAAARRGDGGFPALGEPRDLTIARLYDTMRKAMRSGNWTQFGAAFDSLGTALGKPPR